MTENFERCCISLPIHIIDTINSLRGDISKSRFIMRLIETGLEKFKQEKNEK